MLCTVAIFATGGLNKTVQCDAIPIKVGTGNMRFNYSRAAEALLFFKLICVTI